MSYVDPNNGVGSSARRSYEGLDFSATSRTRDPGEAGEDAWARSLNYAKAESEDLNAGPRTRVQDEETNFEILADELHPVENLKLLYELRVREVLEQDKALSRCMDELRTCRAKNDQLTSTCSIYNTALVSASETMKALNEKVNSSRHTIAEQIECNKRLSEELTHYKELYDDLQAQVQLAKGERDLARSVAAELESSRQREIANLLQQVQTLTTDLERTRHRTYSKK